MTVPEKLLPEAAEGIRSCGTLQIKI